MMNTTQLVTIISRETIKPSSPTPSHLQTYNFSPLDQLEHNAYIPALFFYPNEEGDCTSPLSLQDKANVMKKALSDSLGRYYPFAGTLQTETTSTPPYVDCNDKGIVFVVAEINSQLSTFQHFTEEDETLDQLFADVSIGNNCNRSNSLAAVQLNHFTCGGVAVAASMSHLIGDGCTLFSFVSHWASVTRYGSSDHKEVLPLNPSFIITPQEQLAQVHGEGYVSTIMDSTKPQAQVMSNKVYGKGYVSKTFLFPNSKLSDLKNKVKVMSQGSINNPTRNEVLLSLIFKTAVGAESTRSGSFKPSYLWIPVDIRSKFVPKLPQITVGNFVSPMMIKTMHETQLVLHLLVGEIKKEKMRVELMQLQSVQQAAENSKKLRKDLENEIKDLESVANQTYCGSSFCGFSFDKVDFGWGKPAGATLPVRSVGVTSFILVDTADGGIEARVNLKKENMEIFENDEEMLSFCHST